MSTTLHKRRKNCSALSDEEKNDFVRALVELKSQGTYDDYVELHVVHFGMGHSGPQFLPWHRELLRRFENDLRSIDPSVALPYWDWTVDDSPETPLWDDDFMGTTAPGGGAVTTGPFSEWGIERYLGLSSRGSLPTREEIEECLSLTPYYEEPDEGFSRHLETDIHNPPHVWVGGDMNTAGSPADPVFWLHHSNIDRLWAEWQNQHPNEGYQPVSGGAEGQNMTDMLHGWETRIEDVLDHHVLGYSYDTEPEPEGTPPSIVGESIGSADENRGGVGSLQHHHGH